MSDITQTFFERLAQRGYEPLLHSTSGTIQADIEGVGRRIDAFGRGRVDTSTMQESVQRATL